MNNIFDQIKNSIEQNSQLYEYSIVICIWSLNNILKFASQKSDFNMAPLSKNELDKTYFF